MTVWYIDPENGTDASASAGNGDSFATRRKRLDNLVAAALAPGDEVRVMASPDPTSLGITGEWTGGPLLATKNIVSSTNATPIVLTVTSHGYTTGDTIYVTAHGTNTNANGCWEITVIDANTFSLQNADGSDSVGNGIGGASGTVRKINSSRVMLASALTANIACFGNQGSAGKAQWTAAANVTTAVSTDFKEGYSSASVAVAAGFTTGLAAYFPTGTLNLSAYQQVSFKIKQTIGTVAVDGDLTLRLCSDAAGVTTVHTIAIPGLGQLNTWTVITVDLGAALSSSIQSVALYVAVDRNAQTFLIDNIIACKAPGSADSLTLSSLIGKNAAGETWLGLQSINGKRLMLDRHSNCYPIGASTGGGWGLYGGDSGTVTAYKREPMIPGAMLGSASSQFWTVQDAGTMAAPNALSGGWNRTDMSTRTGETWVDGRNGVGLFVAGQQSHWTFDRISGVRYSGVHAQSTYANNWKVTNSHANNCGAHGFGYSQCGLTRWENCYACCNTGAGFQFGYSHETGWHSNLTAYGNYESNILFNGSNHTIDGLVTRCAYNGGGIQLGSGSDNFIRNGSSKWNAAGTIRTGGLNNGGGYCQSNRFENFLFEDSTELTVGSNNIWAQSRIWSKDHDQTPGNHVMLTYGGRIYSEDVVRHTASGNAWRIEVLAVEYTSLMPLTFELARVAVAANGLVTAKLWMRRDNIGIETALVCKGGQIAGVSADVRTWMTAAANTWEEVTVTFTPTEAGVVTFTVETYGGTTRKAYVDDFSVTQA